MPQYLALIHLDMQLQFSALVSSSFLMYFSWVLPLELCIELCIELSKVFQNSLRKCSALQNSFKSPLFKNITDTQTS